MIKRIFFLGLVLFLLGSTLAFCQENNLSEIFSNAPYREINASIMSIDFDNDMMIVAEKKVKLLTYIDKNGVKKYQTQFLDSLGNRLTLNDFKIKDKVIVEGVLSANDAIIASGVTKLRK